MDLESSGLYQWCEDNGIPITFHCSSGGFPPGDKWQYDNYGDPANWDQVLANHNDLIVDFAHYGHSGQGWPAHIATLVSKYPNVYTDLACYTSEADLKAVQKQFESTPLLRNRLMFGTDFNVMLVTDLVNLQSYFDTFKKVFSPDELGTMACDVPMEFLGKLQTTQAPAIATPGIDREARSSFVAQVTKENRFGWVRDLPDMRDFTSATDRITKKHVDAGVSHSVKRLTQNGLIAAQRSPRLSIDLRQWCSPVEDQGTISSCTAHAAIALVEYYELRTARKHIDASRLFLYKVSRNLLKWSGDSGARLRTAMEALALFGVPPEEYMPYDVEQFDAEPSAFCYAFGKNYQTASYYRLDPPGTKPQALLSGIRCALQAGYPLMFGFTVYDSMGEAKNNAGRIPFPSPQDRVIGGHAVAAVGYDDRMVVKNSDPNTAPTRGALLVRNSWGSSWGDHGYGWLPYEYVLQGLAVDWWSIIKQEWVDLESFELITA